MFVLCPSDVGAMISAWLFSITRVPVRDFDLRILVSTLHIAVYTLNLMLYFQNMFVHVVMHTAMRTQFQSALI